MDPKRQAYIYDSLLKLNIELNFEDIPTPAYIQEKLIQCNQYQIIAEKFFIEATREYTITERNFKIESMQLDMLRRQMLINNDRVKSLPTGKEREAAVNDMLEKENERLLKIENEFDAVKNILTVIRQKQGTLKGVNANIKVLVGLMEQQINRLNIGHPDDPEVRRFAKDLAEIDEYEKEMDLDDVESSVEIPQSDDSEDQQQSGLLPGADTPDQSEQESIEIGEDFSSDERSQEELGESVAPGELDLSNLDLVSNEKSRSEARSEQDTADPEDQDINSVKVSDDEQQSGPLPDKSTTPDESGQDTSKFEDEISSFLEEHDSSPFFPKDDELAEMESDTEEESGSTNEESVAEDDPFSISDINIEVPDTSEDSSKPVTKEPPDVQVGLEELGIDIDVEDSGTDPPTETSSESPSTKENISTNEKEAGAKKKADDSDIDLDLNDILSSLDD